MLTDSLELQKEKGVLFFWFEAAKCTPHTQPTK
jgi:hypothetical protein